MNWPKTGPNLPDSIELGNPTGLAMDTSQHLVVFHRAREEPGRCLGSMPSDPHSIQCHSDDHRPREWKTPQQLGSKPLHHAPWFAG